MGANAQTTVPTFTAAQVLTADQMNQSARTGVPVFADTTARDAAFGGSGEKTLAEGQLCYLESTNVVQYYDGAAWATVGPAAAAGMVLITSATFTGVASVSMPAGTFTTTYKNYRVFLHVTSTSTGQNVGVRVNVSGSAQTASNYYGGWAATDNSGVYSGFGSNAASSAVFVNAASGQSAYGEFTVYDPTNASTKTWWSGTGSGAASSGNTAGVAGGNLYNVAAAHDGLTFVVGGTITGSYYVYGLTS